METRIIEALRREGRPMAPETLMECFRDQNETDSAAAAISKLLVEGRLILTRKKKLALPEQTGLVFGRIQGNARGYGFFIPEDGSPDMFVQADAMHGALNGDAVWVRRTDTKSRTGKDEAEVMLIATRANATIVGTYESGASGGYVVPDEQRISMDAFIPADLTKNARPGDKVVIEVTDFPDGRRPMAARITEVLGASGTAGTDMVSIIRRLDLPDKFPKNVLKQAKALNRPVSDDVAAVREDMRGKLIFTIDGADARDFDDAVSLEPVGDNWLLGVHIADVSAYVAEGTPLDDEARKRGTSVYFPDRVLPMFPEDISNGVCSLNEGEDKLTLSCMMTLDAEGRILSHRLTETVIRSRHRLTYDDVNALLAGDDELRGKYSDAAETLENMKKVASLLNGRRMKRGSLDFDIDESEITLDGNGKAIDVRAAVRGISNRMIEEFMLAANETVAAHAAKMGIPFMYRVHETPDKTKLTELSAFLNSLGINVKGLTNVKPATFQRILKRVAGTKDEAIVNRVVLRSMKKARYCEKCLGHFGLAAEYYCHFTSPIRRYPDLTVHRLVKLMLSGELTRALAEKYEASMQELARHCSDRELAATEAERAADDLKKCEYMSAHIGELADGIISGVVQYGFFVRLGNTVEGMVRAATLTDDYYSLDEKGRRFVGRNSGKTYRVGDGARIKVMSVDMVACTIDFALASGTHGGADEKPKHADKAKVVRRRKK